MSNITTTTTSAASAASSAGSCDLSQAHGYIYGTNTIRCFSPPQNALPGGIRDHAGYEHSHDACGGGTLENDLKPEPNRNWGVAK